MSFFRHRRHDDRGSAPADPAPQSPVEPLPAAPVFAARDAKAPAPPPPAEPLSEAEVLARLERTLHGPTAREPRGEPVDLLDRVFELACTEWTEQEAGAELAWLADYDRRLLKVLHQRLVASLVRNPFPDAHGVRASRVAASAMRICSDRSRVTGWGDLPSTEGWR